MSCSRRRLQHAQELALHAELQITDLVEEQRAAISRTNEAAAILRCPGEGAFAMSEELAFREARAERSAIQRHEGPSTPLRVETVNARAISSLPVPVSPLMRTGRSLSGLTFRIHRPSDSIAALSPTMPNRAIASPRCCFSSRRRSFLLDRDEEATAELRLEIRPTAVEHFVHAREQRPTLQPQWRTVPFVGVHHHIAAAVAQLSHDREFRFVVSAESDESDAFR